MKFPWVEIGIVLSSVTLVGILSYPQYKEYREKENDGWMKYNLHLSQVTIEKYALYHKGYFPKEIQELEPYFENPGSYPTNPFTRKPLKKEEIKIFYYSKSEENRDNSLDGINGQQRGPQGGIGLGLYIHALDTLTPKDTLTTPKPSKPKKSKTPVDTLAPKDSLARVDSLVTEYGLIGFNREGVPIKIEDPSGRDYLFILRSAD